MCFAGAVQCFDSIASLQFGDDEETKKELQGMNSSEGEKVSFTSAVTAIGNVENWLGDVEGMMRTTLFDLAKESLLCYPPDGEAAIDRSDWFFEFPAQITILIDQVMWTRCVASAIEAVQSGENKNGVREFFEFSQRQLESMVGLVRSDLTRLQRKLMGALIVIDVHARDAVTELMAKEVKSLDDFEWTRQLRYYWDDAIENIVVRQTNTRFVYGYEYLGNSDRLVITPLTDKCYMTLTGALHLRFGGAPAGPAGTGKVRQRPCVCMSVDVDLCVKVEGAQLCASVHSTVCVA